jgi:hypothetical protein
MSLRCDCGADLFLRFGPYDDAKSDDTGLRWIYTCSSCGEQLRVYQTSPAWRAARGLSPATHKLAPHCDDPGCLTGRLIGDCVVCGARGVSAGAPCPPPGTVILRRARRGAVAMAERRGAAVES